MSKRKKTKLEQAAHIKERTAGTSNEISFSVLDAAKKAVDGETPSTVKRGLRLPSPLRLFGKKSVSTPTKEDALPITGEAPDTPPELTLGPGLTSPTSIPDQTAGPLYSNPEEEVARRKNRRKKSNRLAIGITAIVVLVLIGGAGYFLFTEFTNHAEQVTTLEDALELVAEADETIIAIDEILASPIDEEAIEKAEEILAGLETTKGDLRTAKREAQAVSENLRDSADKEAATQTLVAIEAREEMLDLGADLLEEDITAKQATDAINGAWELLLHADALSREATALANEATLDTIEASINKTREAIAEFEKAQSLVTEAKKFYPAAEYGILEQYLAKKIEALTNAILSDEAIVAQDKQAAQHYNGIYNQADAEATELAKQLPDNPAQPIATTYESATKTLRDDYQQARTEAGIADSFLRDYLGTSNK